LPAHYLTTAAVIAVACAVVSSPGHGIPDSSRPWPRYCVCCSSRAHGRRCRHTRPGLAHPQPSEGVRWFIRQESRLAAIRHKAFSRRMPGIEDC
jgi:hypothetical protein